MGEMGRGGVGKLSQVVPLFSVFLPFPTNFTHFFYTPHNVFLAISHKSPYSPISPISPHFPIFPFFHFSSPLRLVGQFGGG